MRPGFWQILLVVVVVLVLFGYNKFPELMKNLANGINIFKKEIKETKDATSVAVEQGAKKVTARRAASAKAETKPASKPQPKRRPTKKSLTK